MAKKQSYKWNKQTQSMEPEFKAASDVEAPFVQDDTLPEPIESMATPDRQMFDSKSAYERHLKAHGYEVTGGSHNTGNHGGYKRKVTDCMEERERKAKWGMLPPSDVRHDLLETQRKLKWGMHPLSKEDRAKWNN